MENASTIYDQVRPLGGGGGGGGLKNVWGQKMWGSKFDGTKNFGSQHFWGPHLRTECVRYGEARTTLGILDILNVFVFWFLKLAISAYPVNITSKS